MPRRLTTDEFIVRAKTIHGEAKYDYSLVDYTYIKSKVTIICKKHGIFEQTAGAHLEGRGCHRCAIDLIISIHTYTTEEFITRALKVHPEGTYDYSLVDYKYNDKPVLIICPVHGPYEQKPLIHLAGSGCRKCYEDSLRMAESKFINDAMIVHEGYYSYDKVVYKQSQKNVIITCPIHGDFLQKPSCHLRGQGCKSCSRTKGEAAIARYLTNREIAYTSEKTYKDCVNPDTGGSLRYDFHVPRLNLLIEFDGRQHFDPISFTSNKSDEYKIKMLQGIQHRDQIKNKYAENKDILLLRIPYTKIKKIPDILDVAIAFASCVSGGSTNQEFLTKIVSDL